MYQEETVGIKVPEESTSQGPTEPGVTSETVGVKVPEESTTQVPTEPGIPADTQILKGILTIVDMEFSDDLSKSSSKAFKTLAGDLTKLLDGIFQSITGFLYTKVDSFEKGSIVCKFSIFTKAGSSSAKDYKTALVAASKEGKTGKFKMEKIEVYKTESVGTFKGEKSQKVFQPLKVIGITIFVTAVVMVVLFLVVKAILKRRKRRREGYSHSYDVYPLNEFDIKDAAEPTFGKMRRLEEEAEDIEEGAGEATPLNKPS